MHYYYIMTFFKKKIGWVFFDVSCKEERLILCLLQTALFLYVGLVRRTRNSPKKQPSCWRPSRLLCCSAKKATARAASPSDETYFYNLSELPEWINLPIHLAETLLDANYEDMWNVVLPMYGALRKCFFKKYFIIISKVLAPNRTLIKTSYRTDPSLAK